MAASHAAVDTYAARGLAFSIKVRNFGPCGTFAGGASSLVVNTTAWSSSLFNNRLVNSFGNQICLLLGKFLRMVPLRLEF